MHLIAREWQVRLDLLAGDPQLTVPRASLPRSSNIMLAQADRFVAVRVYLCRTTAWSSFASSLSKEVVMAEITKMADEAKKNGPASSGGGQERAGT